MIRQGRSGGSGIEEKKWRASQLSRNVFKIEVDFEKNADWEFWMLLTSDRHWDSPKSNIKLQERHLKQAVERGAVVVDIGDALDLLGGRFDPRSSKSSIRPEYMVPNYFDAVVGDFADWLQPYASNIAILGQGNHETAMTSRHEFCPTERVVTLLNYRGANVFNGAYSGWVTFRFQRDTKARTVGREVILHYHHGHSHGKTQSNITAARERSRLHPDADIIAMGHAHNGYSDMTARVRLGQNGFPYHDNVLLLGCPSYKDDIGIEDYGWAVEKGFEAKPIGAWWVRFTFEREGERIRYVQIPAT